MTHEKRHNLSRCHTFRSEGRCRQQTTATKQLWLAVVLAHRDISTYRSQVLVVSDLSMDIVVDACQGHVAGLLEE
jgi:hypothetical protein